MIRKSIGLENLVEPEVVPEPVETPPMTDEMVVDSMAVSDEATMAGVEGAGDVVAEAEGMRDAMAESAEMVRAGEPAKVLAPVLEHFRQRLGLPKSIVAMESLEDGAKTADELEAFLPAMDESIAVAQEGFVTKLTSGLEHMFRSYDAIETKMHTAVGKLFTMGSAEELIEGDFSAADIYKRIGKAEVSGADVVKLMNDLGKTADSLVPFARQVTTHVNAVARIFAEGVFVAGKDSGNRIKAEFAAIDKLASDAEMITKEIKAGDNVNGKIKLMLKPVDVPTAKKLADITSMSKRLKTAVTMVEEISQASEALFQASSNAVKTRLLGTFAEDWRTTEQCIKSMRRDLIDAIWALAAVEKRVVYANFKYIQSSISKTPKAA